MAQCISSLIRNDTVMFEVEAYLKERGAKTKPIENVDNAVLILWVEDTEGNYLAVEQWLNR